MEPNSILGMVSLPSNCQRNLEKEKATNNTEISQLSHIK